MSTHAAEYQNFHSDILVAMSDISDGTMKQPVNQGMVDERNARAFLQSHGVAIDKSIKISLDYNSENFCRYATVDSLSSGDGMVKPSTFVSDATFTKDSRLALFLPLADCVGVILYDPQHRVLGLSHLGRHNLEQQGGVRTVTYMVNEFQTDPSELYVLLTAAAGKSNYPLYAFENKSLHEVATNQLMIAGVQRRNITVDSRDTTTDDLLYSHSVSIGSADAPAGRQAVFAMIR